jgi:hypothetical protein
LADDNHPAELWHLPPLSGTAKQIAWAQTIREQAVVKLGDRLQDPAVLAALVGRTEAGWWIDHRGNPAREVPRLAGPTERDRAEGRERTQRLLAWVLDGPPRPSLRVEDPRWRRGHGVCRPDPISLNGLAGRVFTAWGALVSDYLGVLDRAALRAWATEHPDTAGAALLNVVLDDVDARTDLRTPRDSLIAEWTVAEKLRDLDQLLNPRPPVEVPPRPTRCRHGRLFTEPCAKCGD